MGTPASVIQSMCSGTPGNHRSAKKRMIPAPIPTPTTLKATQSITLVRNARFTDTSPRPMK